MSWQLLCTHPWRRPLDFAACFGEEAELALLYSGRQEAQTGRFSYLFLEAVAHQQGSHWQELPPVGGNSDLPDWVGYLGYGMRVNDGYDRAKDPVIPMPDFWLTRYARLFRFDHDKEVIEEWGRFTATSPHDFDSCEPREFVNEVVQVRSIMTRTRYERMVRDTVSAIEAGDFYQANITRKFYGSFKHTADTLALFAKLCAVSPAPYSAYIRHGGMAILSASPECFLTINREGAIISRPIKGSIRRGVTEAEDVALRKALASSGKNLAENLMIVDLIRHDLSQVSEVNSVAVAEQSQLYSYATIHHLVSTVRAQKLPGKSAYDVVHACFPPGSMTGAPKRAVIQWCQEQEQIERGVYSGAIGWFGAHDTCDLSVVIRTLIIDGDKFEFQVGGGVVAESTPEDEWRETLVKARGIAAALGIKEKDLEAL